MPSPLRTPARIAPALFVCVAALACGRAQPPAAAPAAARNLIVVTVDTLRADRVGAYGYAAARTPAVDALARRGVTFDRAFATAPITLVSHASLFSGRYPPGHHARDNGMRVDSNVPLLAETLLQAGFSTAAFVAAFPLDRRFGLNRGFATYGDRLPRQPDGRPANERPGRAVLEEALQWLASNRTNRFFLWVHLFEPHTPYGDASDPAQRGRPATARYDDEVAEADRLTGRLLDALGGDAASTLVVFASDHGEAFGEHGEIGHSVFVYDTTLRVALVMAGPGVPEGRRVGGEVSLVDVAPTVVRLLGLPPLDADGIDLRPAISGAPLGDRELYSETFAPLLDFGWSSLRTVRAGGWKYIAAPRAELYHVAQDVAEANDTAGVERARAAAMASRADKYSGPELPPASGLEPEAASRLRALGYASGSARGVAGRRADPKDRRELAARIARVASGELRGVELEQALRQILADDPGNPQANLRLGYVLLESDRCPQAVRHFRAAIDARLPGAEAYLGLAGCEVRARRFAEAARALAEAVRIEPDNAAAAANLAIVTADGGDPARSLPHFERALQIEPNLHQARFNFAIALARLGRREEAAAQAQELLRRLPPTAPQRGEVERLLGAVR